MKINYSYLFTFFLDEVRQIATHLRILDESRETLNCAHVKSSSTEVDEIQGTHILSTILKVDIILVLC